MYIITRDYSLYSLADIVGTNEFSLDFSAENSSFVLVLPKGFLLNTFSITITEEFDHTNYIKVYVEDNAANRHIIAQSVQKTSFEPETDNMFVIDDDLEEDETSEFTFKLTEKMETESRIIIEIQNDLTESHNGQGILKIN